MGTKTLLITALALGCLAGGCGGDSDADPGSDEDPASRDASYVFDDRAVRTFQVELSEADLSRLNRDPAAEIYVPATVYYDGEEFARAAIRYKGSFGSLYSCVEGFWKVILGRDCDKLNFKLKFSEYDDERRFYGLKRINLHGMDKDYSRIREIVAYRVFREYDVPASRAAYAQLEINGEPMGLYLAVEEVDGQFTRARFEDGGKGNLYKEVWFDQTNPAAWRGSLHTNRDEDPDVSHMTRMGRELLSAPLEEFKTTLARWIDVDQLMRYLAVEQTIGHWDSTTAFYCGGSVCGNHNYYLYEYTDRSQVALIAWDLDLTFANFGTPNILTDAYGVPAWNDLSAACNRIRLAWGQVTAPACNPIIKGLASELADEYASATQGLLDTVFKEDVIHDWIDEYSALIAPIIPEDQHGPSPTGWEEEVVNFKDEIGSLRQRAIAAISK